MQFTNNSELATFYSWNFGDDQTSNEESPTHTFGAPGAYEVTLNAQNAYCGRATSIILLVTSDFQVSLEKAIKVFPNPTQDKLYVQFDGLQSTAQMNGILFDVHGQQLWKGAIGSTQFIDLASFPSGLYMLEIRIKEGRARFRVVKE